MLQNKPHAIPCIISIFFLSVALLPMPYFYYDVVRVVVCGTCLVLGFMFYNRGYNWILWVLAAAAVVYNPVFNFFLDRATWVTCDLIVIVLLAGLIPAVHISDDWLINFKKIAEEIKKVPEISLKEKNIFVAVVAVFLFLFAGYIFMGNNAKNNSQDARHMTARELYDILLEEKKSGSKQNMFHGYVCKDDCSGHKAGYEWAKRNAIKNSRHCKSRSQSFDEGCQVYVKGKSLMFLR